MLTHDEQRVFFQLAVSPSSIGAAWRRLYLQLRAGWTFLPLRALLQKVHWTSQSWLDSVHARKHIPCGASCNKGFKVHQEKNDRLDLLRVCAWCGRTRLRRCVSQADIGSRLRQTKARGKTVREFGSSPVLEGSKMSKPDYSGTYHMVEQKNMDAYLEVLGEAGVCLNLFPKHKNAIHAPSQAQVLLA